jgi:hypothetical protein
MGNRPDEKSLTFIGGNYNMLDNTLTLNTHSPMLHGTLDNDIERRKRRFARWERTGRKVGFGNVSGESLEGCFIHEYGHAIDATYGIAENQKFLQYYKSLSKEAIELGVSDYATTDASEFIAECFADSFFEDQQEISKGFMKVLEEIINDTH